MRILSFGLVLGATLGLVPSAAQAQAAFDGRWSVEVITEKGGCDKAYRYAVLIENGQVRYGGQEPIQVSGQVSRNGAVRAEIAGGQDKAEVTGRLDDTRGSGTWSAKSASRDCSGRWNADRRG